ncbi:hypothetical protein ACFVTY_03485 [Streptomyces sp. NPDC058067]|uniref:hypothetical protein n=1 Tax=Streptomyces sp. NPDC058067 TaxID=3346324 RepID=UPI0036E337D2
MADITEPVNPGVVEDSVLEATVIAIAPEHRRVPGSIDVKEVQLVLLDLQLRILNMIRVAIARLRELMTCRHQIRNESLILLRIVGR